jgi:putative acetyltransferase
LGVRIEIEDPGQPEILAFLEAGEAYAAALYPAESNHFLPLDALRAENVRFVVARNSADGSALGTGAIALYEGWAELKRMWVDPAARGRGLSKAILADLEARAKAAGVFALRLETGIENFEALKLYERSGFARCAPFADYKPDPLSVFMEKNLMEER